VKSVVLAFGFFVATAAPAAAFGGPYTLVVPIHATSLPLTYRGAAITWHVDCMMYAQPNQLDIIAQADSTFSPKAPSGDFNGNVSVVFTPLPTQPAGQSYSCMLYPMTSAGGIQGWMGYTPGPTQQYYQGVGNISGNGNFP
jgi:hypothetical protein